MLQPNKLASKNFLSSLDITRSEIFHIFEIAKNFKNKDFIIDLSGALEDQNGKKDINKIDKLLNLFEKT